MPFKPGNQEGKKKKGSKHTHVQDYLNYLATGAARHYYENLERQFTGEEIPKPVQDAMDRFEKNTEFITPKLARTESQVEADVNMNITWKS